MKYFKAEQIDARDVKARFKELFKGHKHLTLGINNNNNMRPKKYQISLRQLLDDRLVRLEAAAFISQVKVVFKDNNEKYSEFIQVMKDFNHNKTDALSIVFFFFLRLSIVEMVIKLFKGHTDLLLEFNKFMPEGYLSEQISLVPLYYDHNQGHQLVIKDAFLNKVKLVFQDNKMEIYYEFLQVIDDHNSQGSRN
ncbi:hypothetical protein P8452_72486 [Trifolium repens]|nr:hypothetical protein P8452_72486 [Trifolium repens]